MGEPSPSDSCKLSHAIWHCQQSLVRVPLFGLIEIPVGELREVFERSLYLDMTQDEIATELSVSTKTIKRRWRDAKFHLEGILNPDSRDSL